jgi:CTP:molybdopterin cytidylyltransferase MocA
MNCKALILAGGKSERMSSPKPFLKYNGRTFLEKIVNEFIACDIEETVVVLNHELFVRANEKYLAKISEKCILLKNTNPEWGRYHSLKLGIDKVIGADFCFIHNVDNPFVSSTLIKELYSHRNAKGYTLPVYKSRGGHPVLISKIIMKTIHSSALSSTTLKDVLINYSRKELVVNDDSILANINTPEEYYHEMIKHEILRNV